MKPAARLNNDVGLWQIHGLDEGDECCERFLQCVITSLGLSLGVNVDK
jgi:hypothetical protein